MQNISKPSSVEWKIQLEKISTLSENYFLKIHQIREQSLKLSREIIRNSAISIRASHRSEFEQARNYLVTAEQKIESIIDQPPPAQTYLFLACMQ